MKLRRHQLILVSLILALGVAVYLNWQFSDNNNLVATDVLHPQKELGEARYVNNANVPSSEEEPYTQTVANTNMSPETKEYFAKARMDRQKAHDEAIENVKKALSGSETSQEFKNEAIKQTEEIAKTLQEESNIENLIKAKGFSECLVFIQNGECSVVVSPGSLNESSVITIRDIVSGQSNIPFEKIKIIEAKNTSQA